MSVIGTMPDFSSFKKITIDDEAIQTALEATENKYLEIGLHEVKVASIEFKNPSEKDPTWINAEITFEGVGGKTAKTYKWFPTQKLTYGEKETMYMFKEVMTFLSAVGVDLPMSKLLPNLGNIISQLGGKHLNITIGYPKGHYIIQYLSKDSDGTLTYGVLTPEGTTYVDEETNEPVTYTSKDAAIADLTSRNMKFTAYTKVLEFSRSETENVFKLEAEKPIAPKAKVATKNFFG